MQSRGMQGDPNRGGSKAMPSLRARGMGEGGVGTRKGRQRAAGIKGHGIAQGFTVRSTSQGQAASDA